MKHIVEDFFKHEISEMHKNIDRIEHGLKGRDLSDPALAGQCEMLKIQQEHLDFLEKIATVARTYEQAILLCQEFVLKNEQTHRQLSQQEDTIRHSVEWWQSLHRIQYGTDLLHRIETWEEDYRY